MLYDKRRLKVSRWAIYEKNNGRKLKGEYRILQFRSQKWEKANLNSPIQRDCKLKSNVYLAICQYGGKERAVGLRSFVGGCGNFKECFNEVCFKAFQRNGNCI